ncbi:MAG: proton-conducting transporter membrane subunit, partial [Polyangiaceae bacterium]
MLSLFPANDYALIAVILGMPLLGAFVNGVFGKRLGDSAVKAMSLAAIGVSFAAAIVAFFALASAAGADKDAHVKLVWNAWEWMHTTGGRDDVRIPIDVKFSIDQLSGVMMLVVTGVSFLIHLYATSYMEKDPGYARFFAYMNLFVFAMLVLILADNLPLLFVGWEGVGLCSYLLVGYYFDREYAAAAGRKAFVVNRIGDYGFLLGMFGIFAAFGSLNYTEVFRKAAEHPAQFSPVLSVICLCLFVGAMGK